ncbi:hypothetical protein Glove_856g54 [Diversispora epigaea]|uniref:Transposase Tc1-like domain-containing protein n=1 Tax=Diversispora epigaea TaxID=1348612 RepID=A0A397G2J2_9GLOM|nr:hypothetical protein Glove_856g54 [Diversispora epigaea]
MNKSPFTRPYDKYGFGAVASETQLLNEGTNINESNPDNEINDIENFFDNGSMDSHVCGKNTKPKIDTIVETVEQFVHYIKCKLEREPKRKTIYVVITFYNKEDLVTFKHHDTTGEIFETNSQLRGEECLRVSPNGVTFKEFKEKGSLCSQEIFGESKQWYILIDVEVSHSTVSRHLAKAGYLKNLPLGTPMLTDVHKRKRVEWANKHIYDNWNKTFFSDETAFQLFRNTIEHWYKGAQPIRCIPKKQNKNYGMGPHILHYTLQDEIDKGMFCLFAYKSDPKELFAALHNLDEEH